MPKGHWLSLQFWRLGAEMIVDLPRSRSLMLCAWARGQGSRPSRHCVPVAATPGPHASELGRECSVVCCSGILVSLTVISASRSKRGS